MNPFKTQRGMDAMLEVPCAAHQPPVPWRPRAHCGASPRSAAARRPAPDANAPGTGGGTPLGTDEEEQSRIRPAEREAVKKRVGEQVGSGGCTRHQQPLHRAPSVR